MLQKISPVWYLIGGLVLADLLGLHLQGMHVAISSLILPVSVTFVMLALAEIYTRIRPDIRIASIARISAALLTYTAVTAIFSYLMVTLRHPLLDPSLVAADHALGFDWLAMYKWVVAHPRLHLSLYFIYSSLIPQMILLQIVLHFRGQIERGQELLWLFVISSLGCILFSGFWPTEGAFLYYHVAPQEPYVQQFQALRDGTLHIIDLKQVQGVVQFPSLHLALAVLFTYAARGMWVLFPVLAVLNALVIVATPSIGGHHLSDLWGGFVLAAITIWLTKEICPLPKKTRKKSAGARPAP